MSLKCKVPKCKFANAKKQAATTKFQIQLNKPAPGIQSLDQFSLNTNNMQFKNAKVLSFMCKNLYDYELEAYLGLKEWQRTQQNKFPIFPIT